MGEMLNFVQAKGILFLLSVYYDCVLNYQRNISLMIYTESILGE